MGGGGGAGTTLHILSGVFSPHPDPIFSDQMDEVDALVETKYCCQEQIQSRRTQTKVVRFSGKPNPFHTKNSRQNVQIPKSRKFSLVLHVPNGMYIIIINYNGIYYKEIPFG